MATCFKRQIQTSADISPMCSKDNVITSLVPHGGRALRTYLGGCSLSGVVWCGVVLRDNEASEIPSSTHLSMLLGRLSLRSAYGCYIW